MYVMRDPIIPNCVTQQVREVLAWEQVYADRPNDDGKYYWKSYDMKLVDFDLSYNIIRSETRWYLKWRPIAMTWHDQCFSPSLHATPIRQR